MRGRRLGALLLVALGAAACHHGADALSPRPDPERVVLHAADLPADWHIGAGSLEIRPPGYGRNMFDGCHGPAQPELSYPVAEATAPLASTTRLDGGVAVIVLDDVAEAKRWVAAWQHPRSWCPSTTKADAATGLTDAPVALPAIGDEAFARHRVQRRTTRAMPSQHYLVVVRVRNAVVVAETGGGRRVTLATTVGLARTMVARLVA